MAKDSALTIPNHDPEPAPEAPSRKQIVAPMNSCKLFEQSNLIHRLVSKDATESDLINPAFYSVIQARLRSFDLLFVITAKFAYQVWILYSEIGMPVVAKILHKMEIPVMPIGEHGKPPAGYDVLFDPSTQTYAGIRLRDGKPITQGKHARWSDAFNELVNHAIFRN